MAVNYLLQMFYDIDGQECSNRFFYSALTSPFGNAGDLGIAFVADVLPTIGACLTSLFTDQIIRVRNLGDDTDFTEFATTQVGLRASTIQSQWDAWGFWLLPSSYLIRKGSKRFAGVADVDVSSRMPVAGVVDELNELAVALGVLITGLVAEYTPTIYSPANQTHPGDLYVPVSGAVFKRFTTQNSRKPW